MVVYEALSSATSRAAWAWATRASLTETAARAASSCSGPVCAAASLPWAASTRPAVLAAPASAAREVRPRLIEERRGLIERGATAVELGLGDGAVAVERVGAVELGLGERAARLGCGDVGARLLRGTRGSWPTPMRPATREPLACDRLAAMVRSVSASCARDEASAASAEAEIRARPREPRLVVGLVELDEDVAGFDELVVRHAHRLDLSGDPRRDADEVALYLGVVRRLHAEPVHVRAAARGGREDRRGPGGGWWRERSSSPEAPQSGQGERGRRYRRRWSPCAAAHHAVCHRATGRKRRPCKGAVAIRRRVSGDPVGLPTGEREASRL